MNDSGSVERTHTLDQVFTGAGTAFDGPKGTALDDFPDGPDKTLMVVEAAEAVPWTKAIDLPYMAVAQLPQLGGDFKANSRPFDTRGVDGFQAHLRGRLGPVPRQEEHQRASIVRA